MKRVKKQYLVSLGFKSWEYYYVEGTSPENALAKARKSYKEGSLPVQGTDEERVKDFDEVEAMDHHEKYKVKKR